MAIDGDINAFEKLIIQYEKLIFNVCYRIMGNAEDAKDISQEAIIKIYKNMNKCNDASTFKAWACKIANNACLDELRKRKGKFTQSIDAGDDEIEPQIKSEILTPEEEFIRKETITEVSFAIQKLSDLYRVLLVLRDIQGLSYEEISQTLDMPIGTVKSRIFRARNNLKDIILKLREQKGV